MSTLDKRLTREKILNSIFSYGEEFKITVPNNNVINSTLEQYHKQKLMICEQIKDTNTLTTYEYQENFIELWSMLNKDIYNILGLNHF